MTDKYVRFVQMREQTPPGMDGHLYQLTYELGEKRGGQFVPQTTAKSVEISTSGSLQAVWGKSDEEMSSISGSSAIAQLLDATKTHGWNSLPERIALNTYTAASSAPEVAEIAPGTLFPLAPPPQHVEPIRFSFLSDDISDIRDTINALARSLWGERLLLLSQERPLFDMYKAARNAEEFRTRVQSLSIIAKDLNRSLLLKLANADPAKFTGEFVLLEMVLQEIAQPEDIDAICKPLKQLNNLRQGYPAHGDNADKFLPAHRFFNLSYPVTNFSASWEAVLVKYFAAMRALRDVLARAWKRLEQ